MDRSEGAQTSKTKASKNPVVKPPHTKIPDLNQTWDYQKQPNEPSTYKILIPNSFNPLDISGVNFFLPSIVKINVGPCKDVM
jgi:hypothetical protein